MPHLLNEKIVGGLLTASSIVFSSDSTLVLCGVGETIRVHSVATGKVLRILECPLRVVGVVLNPRNNLQALAVCEDGTYQLWDLLEGTCLSTKSKALIRKDNKHIEHVVKRVAAPKCTSNFFYVCVEKRLTVEALAAAQQNSRNSTNTSNGANTATKAKKKKKIAGPNPYDVLEVNISSGEHDIILRLKKHVTDLKVSPDGTFIAATMENSLRLNRQGQSRRKATKIQFNAAELCTTEFHPTKPLLAVGHFTGEITLVYRYDDPKKIKKVELHWHAHRVTCLGFTNDGAYLVSGGEEAVLVLWQLDTGQKQYLPRLGAPIRSFTISPNGFLYALGLRDNCVKIMEAANSKISATISGLALSGQWQSGAKRLQTGFVVEPITKNVVVNGYHGNLQIYDVFNDCNAGKIEVVPHNLISRSQANEIEPPLISQVAYSNDGSWMVTVEKRHFEVRHSATSKEFEPRGIFMKFWSYDSGLQQYQENTEVQAPHKGVISVLEYCSATERVVTAAKRTDIRDKSYDKSFKLWSTVENTSRKQTGDGKKGGKSVSWTCESTGFYRDHSVESAAFSSDGSILAIAAGQVISLWDPDSLTLHRTLVSAGSGENIIKIFIPKFSACLIAHTDAAVYVWDLIDLSLRWALPLKVKSLAVNPFAPQFAVIMSIGNRDQITKHEDDLSMEKKLQSVAPINCSTTKDCLVLFDFNSRIPMYGKLLPKQHAEALSFVTHKEATQDSASLIYFTRDRTIVREDICTNAHAADTCPSHISKEVHDNKRSRVSMDSKPSVFERMYGFKGIKEVKMKKLDGSLSKPNKRISFYDAPAHILPAPEDLFSSFALSLKRKAAPAESQIPQKIQKLHLKSEKSNSPKTGSIKQERTQISEKKRDWSLQNFDLLKDTFTLIVEKKGIAKSKTKREIVSIKTQ